MPTKLLEGTPFLLDTFTSGAPTTIRDHDGEVGANWSIPFGVSNYKLDGFGHLVPEVNGYYSLYSTISFSASVQQYNVTFINWDGINSQGLDVLTILEGPGNHVYFKWGFAGGYVQLQVHDSNNTTIYYNEINLSSFGVSVNSSVVLSVVVTNQQEFKLLVNGTEAIGTRYRTSGGGTITESSTSITVSSGTFTVQPAFLEISSVNVAGSLRLDKVEIIDGGTTVFSDDFTGPAGTPFTTRTPPIGQDWETSTANLSNHVVQNGFYEAHSTGGVIVASGVQPVLVNIFYEVEFQISASAENYAFHFFLIDNFSNFDGCSFSILANGPGVFQISVYASNPGTGTVLSQDLGNSSYSYDTPIVLRYEFLGGRTKIRVWLNDIMVGEFTANAPIVNAATLGIYNYSSLNDNSFRVSRVLGASGITPPPPKLSEGVPFILDTFTGTGTLATHVGEVGATWGVPPKIGKLFLDGTGGLVALLGNEEPLTIDVTSPGNTFNINARLHIDSTSPGTTDIKFFLRLTSGDNFQINLIVANTYLLFQSYNPTDSYFNAFGTLITDADFDVKFEVINGTTFNCYVDGTLADTFTATVDFGSITGITLRSSSGGGSGPPPALVVKQFWLDTGGTQFFNDTFTGAAGILPGHTADTGQTWQFRYDPYTEDINNMNVAGGVLSYTSGKDFYGTVTGKSAGDADMFYRFIFRVSPGHGRFQFDWLQIQTDPNGNALDTYVYANNDAGDNLNIYNYGRNAAGDQIINQGIPLCFPIVYDTDIEVRWEFLEGRTKIRTWIIAQGVDTLVGETTTSDGLPIQNPYVSEIYYWTQDDLTVMTELKGAYKALPSVPTKFSIGARVDDSQRFIGTVDELRMIVGGGADLTLLQSAPWVSPTLGDTGSDEGWVDITATKGANQITKRFTLTRARRGEDGPHTANVLVYKRSVITPTTPSANVTYTFATADVAGLTNGWTKAIPAGTDPVWVTAASAFDPGATDIIEPAEWASPILYVSNGVRVATIFIFKRTASATLPTAPSGSLTYSFVTALLTGSGFDGWTQNVPDASAGAYLYVTTATALTSSDTDVIPPSEWADVRLMAKDGASGAAGSTGPRGPVNIIWSFSGSAWSDAVAVIALLAGGYGAPQSLDIVTLYNSASGFSETRFFDGTSWLVVTEYLNGNLFVNGTIGALKIVAKSIDTDQLKVGSASASSKSELNSFQLPYQGGYYVNSGDQPILYFTSTGGPVILTGYITVLAWSTNTGDGNGNGDARSFVVTAGPTVDGYQMAYEKMELWSTRAEFSVPSGNPGIAVTFPVAWRGIPSAGQHAYGVQVQFICKSSNGDYVAQVGAYGGGMEVTAGLVAIENKV